MDVTEQTIQRLATLAKLEFDQEEKETFATQLDTILEMVEKLNQLDTTDVPGLYHGIALENVYREDIADEENKRDALLENAPSVKEGLIQVPAMLANEEDDA